MLYAPDENFTCSFLSPVALPTRLRLPASRYVVPMTTPKKLRNLRDKLADMEKKQADKSKPKEKKTTCKKAATTTTTTPAEPKKRGRPPKKKKDDPPPVTENVDADEDSELEEDDDSKGTVTVPCVVYLQSFWCPY